ncbi:MAG: Sucrose-6-phosphate hydrolase [Candidatus Ordinivivax streblomastigis]|uniref:beta-fructofuranosidase n=1 Tax=Candidatus Ordinivivax streblomastigis TaxID=2540710 RepID=A0A5M8NUY2_9BACT|nr:MAG: Sucrose-6-phosphate hydrolase [Candidatus Ordinivivax streblomastigis]
MKFHCLFISILFVFSSCRESDNPLPDNGGNDGDIDITIDCKNPQETGSYTTFYKPQNGYVGDPMPFYDEDSKTFRLFFLYENANHHPIYEVKTKDYALYEDFGNVLPDGNTGSQDDWIGTGSFVKKDGKQYSFYTGHNGSLNPAEKIMLATSTDGKTWTKVPSATFEAPAGYDKNNFRDPCVYYDDTRNCYVMLVVTRKNNQGVLARYTSSDLMQWTLIEPITDLDTDAEIFECPDIFKMGNKWYLLFSRINRDQHRKTFYRIADSPDGPWRICGDKSKNEHHETFDGLYLYAGKTASDGNERFLSGWCSTGQEVNSNKELDWAGSLISHKLVQQADGRLYPVIPDAVDKKFAQKIDFKAIKQTSNVTGSGDSFTINGSTANNYVVFNRNKQPVKITMTIDASQSNKFGIAFGACDNQADTYNLIFDLTASNQWNTPAVFMVHEGKELNFTPLIIPTNQTFEVKIIIEKSVCVLYINNNVAFTNRIYKMNQNPWMLFGEDGSVKFSNIKIYQ